MCQNYKSEKEVFSEGKPNKRSKKGGAKGSVAILMESAQLGCVSQDSYPRKSVPSEPGMLGSKKRRQILRRHLTHQKETGKVSVHREELSNSVRLMSVVLARQNSRKDLMRRPCTKNDAPAEQHGILRNRFTSSTIRAKRVSERRTRSTQASGRTSTPHRVLITAHGFKSKIFQLSESCSALNLCLIALELIVHSTAS